MNHRILAALAAAALAAGLLEGCQTAAPASSSEAASSAPAASSAAGSTAASTAEAQLPDGTYTAAFNTDSGMFHANEACDGKGTLTVKDGVMTLHVSLVSQNIVNLYPGTAEEAQQEGAEWLQPTLDTVTYSDGTSEEVYGFDIPVPALDETFDLALVGTKGTWYDHKVSVSDPEPVENALPELADGNYTCNVTLEGGSGRSGLENPTALRVENGEILAVLVWNSPNYDYMKVGDTQYFPVNEGGNSTFEIPVTAFDAPVTVIADTVAMSTPHEITYTLTFDSASVAETAA